MPPMVFVLDIGFRHLYQYTMGGFYFSLLASAYSVLPSIAGGLSISIILQSSKNGIVVRKIALIYL